MDNPAAKKHTRKFFSSWGHGRRVFKNSQTKRDTPSQCLVLETNLCVLFPYFKKLCFMERHHAGKLLKDRF